MQFLKLFTPVFIAIFLILSDNKFSYLDNAKQSIAKLISPIYLVVNLPSQLYIWIDEQGTTKQTLLNQNRQLNGELTRLKANLQTHNALLLENQKLKQLLGASYQISSQKFILGRVSSVSQSRLKKQIIINKGSNDNLTVGQVVLGSKGVIGQITQTTPLYSTVLMITDPTQYVPIKNQRNGIRGISKGVASNQGRLVVNFIESDFDVVLGDLFLTSAIGSKFPAGYPMGKVIHIEQHTDDPFLHIELAPIQTTEQLEFVLIGEND
ncbi:MAG: rod shape-determining protein MreC [Candidatus Thioglobus sp.]|nr:MAG: rod shape-determining protein MreC [Candidatus Thioglobus sp.]RUM79809.1 MAG: rod shape-determining protein MreC [Candidatus Thioglobus sp.]RUM82382.1 MAG: rod shape-determining protein MreC [Candidatus Thioglobus sp.]